MSVQFGRWNLDGRPVALEYVEKVSATLAPYGPDSKSMYSKEGTAILYHAFHTSKESRYEKQPHTSQHGVITWDGRLDNRNDLVSELDRGLSANSTDVEVVAAAFERWGTKCLGKLIGDWALSVWNPDDCSLLLARDPVGIRHLHYIMEKDYIAWSTTLDPLVLFVVPAAVPGWGVLRRTLAFAPFLLLRLSLFSPENIRSTGSGTSILRRQLDIEATPNMRSISARRLPKPFNAGSVVTRRYLPNSAAGGILRRSSAWPTWS